MAIEYSPEERKTIHAAIESFWLEETGESPGIILRDRIFEFFDQLIGRRAYNQGLADAQAYIQTRLLDMEIDLGCDVRAPKRKQSSREAPPQ